MRPRLIGIVDAKKKTGLCGLVMKREIQADMGSREQGRGEESAENQRMAERRCEGDVRPELDILGWAARAQRLFAITLDA
jgi:hypothetical protein